MIARRTVFAASLAGLGLTALVAGWLATGWQGVRAQARSVREAAHSRATGAAAEMAGALDRELGELSRRESLRPYYHYQNLYHDPRGASSGELFVGPSPLVESTGDPLIAAHYQIDPAGQLTMPTVNEELPELSQQKAAVGNRARLASLRSAIAELGADRIGAGVAVASAQSPPPQAQRAQTQGAQAQQAQAQELDPSAYAQNVSANAIYRQVQRKKQASPVAGADDATSPVKIEIEPFAWSIAHIDRQPHLIAIRTVRTPDGPLAQGFVIDPATANRWLAERSRAGLPATLIAGTATEAGMLSAPVASVGEPWQIAVDARESIAAADAEASAIEARFWRWFIPAGSLALACAAMVVWLVARAERLARERSRFAASAAHELRTPLAGLQLYGDMLGQGLGDPERAREYAQRIADEAARLGRVVGNILGFTRLERGALHAAATPGDAASAARSALDRMRPALEHAGLAIEAEIPAQMPARFDPDATAQVLQNLLDNAERHTRGREPRRVRVSVADAGDGVEIAVADSGPGVAAGMRARLFAPFERGAEADGPAGLGLGLALSRALARAQGGDLIHVAERDGARFVLKLSRV